MTKLEAEFDDSGGHTILVADDLEDNVKMASKANFDAIQFDLDDYRNEQPSILKKKLNEINDRLLRGF